MIFINVARNRPNLELSYWQFVSFELTLSFFAVFCRRCGLMVLWKISRGKYCQDAKSIDFYRCLTPLIFSVRFFKRSLEQPFNSERGSFNERSLMVINLLFRCVWASIQVWIRYGKFHLIPNFPSDHIGRFFASASQVRFRGARSYGKHSVYHMRRRALRFFSFPYLSILDFGCAVNYPEREGRRLFAFF